MAFVKVIKNKAWFKRFQVKYRRRREGRTDYQARRKMIRNDKNKYSMKKYRLIVRFTNSQVICQIAYATITGDIIVSQATSKELENYGLSVGLKNYAAAYCTGLLIARRTLKKFGLDETFKGKEECDAEEYHIEDEEDADQRPFKAILDVGRQSTTVGARMWGALKGAVDGGLHVPHTQKNFTGYKAAEEKGADAEFDAEAHKARILGEHVKDYMEMLEEEDPEKYKAHFSKFIAAGVEPDGMSDLYTDVHSKIREDPEFKPKDKKGITWNRENPGNVKSTDGKDVPRNKKIGLEARRARVQEKISKAQAKMMEDAED